MIVLTNLYYKFLKRKIFFKNHVILYYNLKILYIKQS